MGSRMAANLARAGFAVRAWDPVADRAAAIPGAHPAASARAAAEGAEVVFTMAPDGAAAQEAMFGPRGAAAALAPGTIWIQSATVGIDAIERLDRLAADRGIVLVDAPVLGTTPHAEEGKLTVLASGPDHARAACAALFAPLMDRLFWLGPTGSGTRMKLVVNHWLLTLIGDVAESVALAEALGVDPRQFFEVVDGSPADAPLLRGYGERMLEGRFEPGLALEHARKDALLIARAGRAAGVRPALVEALVELIDSALERGAAGRDTAAIYQALRNPEP
jgi:3-hydroxyisobutyrate dehydrogenase